MRSASSSLFVLFAFLATSIQAGPSYDLSWHTVDCGGATFSSGGSLELGGTLGQPDAGVMTGGNFELVGGFWGANTAGAGTPAATLTAGVSRKGCDIDILSGTGSEPRQGGITELRLTFDVAPGGPGAAPVAIEETTCPAPTFAPYSGSSVLSATVAGNQLVLNFTPGLENARTYRLKLGSDVTTVAGQAVKVRGLIGDVNSDGRTNATDRSLVVGAWTGGGFTCPTDIDNNGATNATDRSLVVGAWTGGQSCAP